MTTPKRTGDDEERIVHGGELPEDDGSLDDIVVDQPSQKKPDEPWTSYLIRRLSYEGIHIEGEFSGTIEDEFICLEQYLNSGVLSLTRYLDLPNFFSAAGSKRVKVSFNVNMGVGPEEICLYGNPDDDLHILQFELHYSKGTAKAKFFTTEPEFTQRPFIRNYEHGRVYSAEQVITDLVQYVKEVGLKQDDNT